ncbi:MAG: stage III sporulation protein AC [Clostridia bacterium]|nr:stage III sporulation protein AC [Clostridia bacterium]MBQ7914962.1 stage III sporulation protein AC [Clostridia bacterium]MBQ8771752.1 stage III sporulation protein AC [Clostridia bacterium]MBQ8872856.1 stage III sporulation protein AC [Clostridia bacterium]MBQ9706716.1 stage III sporulation protein AC [Clostridia bacterium]
MEITLIVKIASIGILTAVISMLLKRAGKEEIATVVSVVGLVIALVMMLDSIAQLYETFKTLFNF